MRQLSCIGSVGLLIVAALVAGAARAPVASAAVSARQDTTAHKSSSTHKKTGTGTHHSSTASGTNSASQGSVKASSNGSKATHSRSASRKKTKKVKGQQAPTTDRINEIQEALASKGAFTGTPTGKWDDPTVDAMKKFQASHGLTATGKLDALTLQKLGLGSQTAGLAAPIAPPNSVNRLRNQSSAPAEPVDSLSEPRN